MQRRPAGGIIYGKNKATSKAEIVLINPINVPRMHHQTSMVPMTIVHKLSNSFLIEIICGAFYNLFLT